MYPANFVHPTKSLLFINKLLITMDVLNIIKSYIYYDVESLNFAKKITKKNEKLTNKIKDSKKITCSPTGYWSLQLKPKYKQKAQFQGYNCNICGEYTLVLWKKYKNINSSLPICFCSDED